MTDSATLARYFGLPLHGYGGQRKYEITTPSDFYIFKAIYESAWNAQILVDMGNNTFYKDMEDTTYPVLFSENWAMLQSW